MKTAQVRIAGKDVILAYCYATEIAFSKYTGQTVTEFIKESDTALKSNRFPDPGKSVYFVLSSVISYYESKNEEPPVKDTDIIYSSSPTEVSNAIAKLIELYAEWYELPKGEPQDAPKKGKNSKNV